jgi:hypothetical protein
MDTLIVGAVAGAIALLGAPRAPMVLTPGQPAPESNRSFVAQARHLSQLSRNAAFAASNVVHTCNS